MRLKDLFTIVNGVQASDLSIYAECTSSRVSIRCPSNQYDGTMLGYVEKSDVPIDRTMPAETIMVGTNGDGSHTFSYVMSVPFVPNTDVVALLPKQTLSLQQKCYYAAAITRNRPRFSYGRKPKGDRLASIVIPAPEEIPAWVSQGVFADYSKYANAAGPAVALPPLSSWKEFRLKDLFTLERGDGPSLEWAEQNQGSTPCISASMFGNGLSALVDMNPTHTGQCLSICANGPVGVTFYQPLDFVATGDVLVLRPVTEMSPKVLLFIAQVLNACRFKFNYGRKFTGYRTNLTIKLPARNSTPDYDLMERFIKGCAFSNSLTA